MLTIASSSIALLSASRAAAKPSFFLRHGLRFDAGSVALTIGCPVKQTAVAFYSDDSGVDEEWQR